MAEKKETVICPSCGFRNSLPLPNDRCVSCGAKVDDLKQRAGQHELEQRYQQEGFSGMWFGIALVVVGVMTAAIVAGLPMLVPAVDLEGYAGMMIAIPVWFLSGVLVGLISPGRTFFEPVAATFLIAMPTAFLLFRGQTVKTMPAFMYVLMSGLGILFSMIGSYLGERVQMGPPPRTQD